ncbi:MAG: coniferyl-alcohol dehydrogenase [Desulfopila sp.]
MLNNKTILVTGVASGIGAATARELQRQGARVIGLDINAPSEKLYRFIQADLTEPQSVQQAVSAVGEPLDGLCNCAGLPPTRPAEQVLTVNFTALRDLIEQLIPNLADNASIVNLASLAGLGWPDASEQVKALHAIRDYRHIEDFCRRYDMAKGRSYFLSKEALIVWTMANRWTWRERGIRMNCVSPGPVDTPILQDFNETLGERAEEDRKIMDRPGTPEDIAPICAFLLSDGSRWLRGTNIAADGGMFAHVQCHAANYE